MSKKYCNDCNYKNFPPDAIPCAYCIEGDEYVQVEERDGEDE